MLDRLYCSFVSAKTAFMNRMREEKGSHTVEIVIFIAIAVGLAIIFRNQIAKLMGNIFKSADKAATDLSEGTVEKFSGGIGG